MALPYMSPAEREAAILNHIRINEVQECVLHQMNIVQAKSRDALIQSTANMASFTAQMTGGVHGFVATGGGAGRYKDHPLKTQYVIREFRMDRNTHSGLNAMIGTLKMQHVEHIRLSVQNHTLYAHRVCCYAACDDMDDLVNMWSVLNFATLFLSVHSADESTRVELKKYAFDPFSVAANIEKQDKMHLTPVVESAAKLLVGYFSGPKLGPASPGFCGSFMTEAIVFNRMLLELFGVGVAGRIAAKNLDFITFSLQVIFCIGPGFIDLGAEPILVSPRGLPILGSLDASDELADAGAKKATEGLHLERFIGKLYVVGDSSGCCSEGLLVSCSEEWDGKAFQFDSARFGCFYTAVLRQRLVVSDQVVFEGENCQVPSITSKIVPKGRRSFEVSRSIGPCATIPIAAILPEYFSTASVTKKHALGRIPIVVVVLSAGRRPVPGQAILEACSIESEELFYQIGDVCYVSTTKGTILPYSAEMQPGKILEIDPLEMYEIVVEGIEELTQRVAQL
jgi:hypothetical protein